MRRASSVKLSWCGRRVESSLPGSARRKDGSRVRWLRTRATVRDTPLRETRDRTHSRSRATVQASRPMTPSTCCGGSTREANRFSSRLRANPAVAKGRGRPRRRGTSLGPQPAIHDLATPPWIARVDAPARDGWMRPRLHPELEATAVRPAARRSASPDSAARQRRATRSERPIRRGSRRWTRRGAASSRPGGCRLQATYRRFVRVRMPMDEMRPPAPDAPPT